MEVKDWKSRSPGPRLIAGILLCVRYMFNLLVLSLIGILMCIPYIRGFMSKKMKENNPYEGTEHTTLIIDRKAILKELQCCLSELWYREAVTGSKAPNVEILNLQTKEWVKLLNLQVGRKNRPLVVCFGSCT
ncbi:hypothetical protein FSP39_022317 [Pinctada imbricata]|uniref:Iodothyronine deiodinase n=1 Tax=Pinctada imbricata TaxID=66713 RepID=A0AA88YJR8_PINIB|nr:hypothetical protein FSP39_022317 [Pinctada imbricata]